ncbi:hypothetical protein [Asaia sp. VD9]|uniref:hypothetical protein n=1 Tax=Asaia sp. VD9 TaxID=3081235 RepID=UPI00301B42EA
MPDSRAASQTGHTPLTLPARLDTKAASALRDELSIESGAVLDGSDVTYLGGLCLQVLLASKRTIINPSEKLVEALSLFGVSSLLQETASIPSETSS